MKHSILRSLLLAVGVVASIASPSIRADAVDDVMSHQMDSKHIPGAVLAVVKHGKVIKLKSYGIVDLEHNIEAKADSVFRIGSVSKQFLAAATLLLAHNGKLSLDDHVVDHLPDAPTNWDDITIRHLLAHTSGLVRESPAFDRLKIQSDADVIKAAYTAPLVFKTGERWQYSNLGYFIVAEIITRVSGQPWPSFIEARIFKPAGMHSTRTVDNYSIIPNRAWGYDFDGAAYRHAATLLALRPSGAFMSTVNDLLKWNAILDSKSVLSAEDLSALWTPVTLNSGRQYRYGLGWEVTKIGSHRVNWHGGSTPGFRSEFMKLPDDELTIILLTNSDTAPIDAMAVLIAQKYVNDLVPDRGVVDVAAPLLESLAGRYQFKSGNTNTFTREGNGLRFVAPALEIDVRLVPTSATTFFNEDDPRMFFRFEKTESSVHVVSYSNDGPSGDGVRI